MKKLTMVLAVLFFTASAAFAQNAGERERKMFVSLGFMDKIIGENFIGGVLNFGYHQSPSSLFTAEVNVGVYDSGKIGSYSYGPYYNPNMYTDGKISYDYTSIEILASWYYVGNISEKFQFRAGPSAGVLIITGSDSYDPEEKNGSKINGIPDSTTETKATVAAGAGIGFIWNFHKRWFLDFGYRALVNAGIDFDEKTIRILGTDVKVEEQEFEKFEHHFNATIGWRF